MEKAQREKGKRGERELANLLKDHGYNCRRGQQYCGTNGDADVVGLPGIHIECKRVERLNLEDAMRQAIDDTEAEKLPFSEEIYPAVFHRRNRGSWLVTMRLDDWMNLYREWDAGRQLDGGWYEGERSILQEFL